MMFRDPEESYWGNWHPTLELRWNADSILQQKWTRDHIHGGDRPYIDTSEEEWRVIPKA